MVISTYVCYHLYAGLDVLKFQEQYFHAVQEVLDDLRHQFIADVDANVVVWELLHKNIISRDVQRRISMTDVHELQNEILLDYLRRTCTNEALLEVCDIFVSVRGHPKMRELGEAMKSRLQTGKCVVC